MVVRLVKEFFKQVPVVLFLLIFSFGAYGEGFGVGANANSGNYDRPWEKQPSMENVKSKALGNSSRRRNSRQLNGMGNCIKGCTYNIYPNGDSSGSQSGNGSTTQPSGQSNGGSSAGGVGNLRLEEIREQVREEVKNCRNTTRKSSNCCNTPLSCANEDSKTASALSTLAVGLATTYQMLQMNQGAADSCKATKNIGMLSGLAQAAMGSMCGKHKNKCVDKCSESESRLAQLWDSCRFVSTDQSALNYCRRVVDRGIEQIDKPIKECNELSMNIAAMAAQLANTYAGVKMAQECEKRAKGEEFQADLTDPMPDCTDPANAAHALCQHRCNRAGAEYDPACGATPPVTTVGGATDLGSSASDYGDSPTNGMSLEDLLGAGDGQGANFANIEPTGSEVSASTGGGGGGVGGGAGGSGDNGDGGGGGYGDSGLDTDILKGEKGGNGYSTAAGGGGGGYNYGGGRGSGGGADGDKDGSAFNLKKFLPGQEKAVKRGLADLGYGSKAVGINSKHRDIWKVVSNRYRQICATGRLVDCRK